ncbi:MAG: BatA domain-containing protein [Planctomycetota bacterium]|jgi:hypothetical protein
MSFLAPGFLWLLGLSLPLIALYFFRQRQEDRVVPTNFLWVQAIQDTRTAAVWRKFLKSILLALQLIFLALLVLALSGATASLWDSGSNRLVVVLLDRSASMGIHDGDEDGATRFEAAVAALDNAIDGLQDGDRMMLIAVDDRAEIIEPYTGEKERLRLAASKLEVRDLSTRLDEAVLLLRSQITAAAGREVEVLLLSDGAFDDPGGLEGARISFVPFGSKTRNAGITDLRIIRGPGASPSLFVSVEVFGDRPLDRTVSLWREGRLVDARQATAEANGQAVAFFPLEGVETGPLEIRLEGDDPFRGDDRAWCVFRPEAPRTFAIYGKGNRFLERIPSLRPGLEGPPLSVDDVEKLRAMGTIDCLVFDGEVPDNPPPARTAIYVNCVPPDGVVTAGADLSYPPVLDWSRTHPITRHADFSDLVVVEGFRLEGVSPTGVLVDSPHGQHSRLVLLRASIRRRGGDPANRASPGAPRARGRTLARHPSGGRTRHSGGGPVQAGGVPAHVERGHLPAGGSGRPGRGRGVPSQQAGDGHRSTRRGGDRWRGPPGRSRGRAGEPAAAGSAPVPRHSHPDPGVGPVDPPVLNSGKG